MNDMQANPADWEAKLHSDSPRALKEALDYYSTHTELAIAHIDQISKLRKYADEHSGMAAAQIEVAAIILYNQLTFRGGR